MTLTLCYVTSRRDPCLQWFWASLAREAQGDLAGLAVVVVDAHHAQRALPAAPAGLDVRHASPKPNVWNGPYRLTRRDYFAAASARNTGLCLAADGYLVFLDDLSVLAPGWLAAVRQAQAGGYVVPRAYQKVSGLDVAEDGSYTFADFPAGHDSRWPAGSATGPVRINGGALYGCSCGAPLEAYLEVNGFDEDNDPMGGEDYCLGLMMERHGRPVYYDRRLLTLEWEEGHHREPPLVRLDKGTSPHDATHRMLDMVLQEGRHTSPNYFGPGGIRDLRQRVRAGAAFPVMGIPAHDWRDGQPLEEM